ncbi:unnamed protein product [Polarella glacialis]|uniref:Uncharacterized protein n=2 Tax=Polarella glacialis TaxID=89957 RepID=A0A813JZ90_POLGL|nr:unnamed protein product [Polarella glacialis]
MHKAWAQQVASSGSKEGPRVSMGDVELGFKEMLLQSRALEYTLEVIASEPSLRQNYMEPLSSPVACLYELLSKTLAFPVAQWAEIIKVAMSGTLPGDQQTDFLLAAISALKCDWHEEVLFNQRKDLALRAEYLRQEIRQVEGSQTDAQLSRRMAASAELLQTYGAVRQNLQEAQTHGKEVQQARESELKLLAEQIQVRVGIDKELEDLETRKRELRIELDDVSRQLDEARTKQRQHMEKFDKQQSELHVSKSALKVKIDAADSEAGQADKEKAVLEQTRKLIQETESALQQSLGGQLDELKQKQEKFQEHFKMLLLDHLRDAEVQVKRIREVHAGILQLLGASASAVPAAAPVASPVVAAPAQAAPAATAEQLFAAAPAQPAPVATAEQLFAASPVPAGTVSPSAAAPSQV